MVSFSIGLIVSSPGVIAMRVDSWKCMPTSNRTICPIWRSTFQLCIKSLRQRRQSLYAQRSLLLVTANTQRELHALERGRHALRAVERGQKVRDYAKAIKTPEDTVQMHLQAAKVALVLPEQDF